MIKKFSSLSRGTFLIINSLAEDVLPNINETFDLVFTSPPYFDREIYSKTDPNQSYVKFPEYSLWLKNWLLDVVLKSSKLLNKDGKIALDLSNTEDHRIEDDFIFISRNYLKVEDILYYETPSVSYLKGNVPVKREKIFIFSKI
jgi:DNA modification methylase